MDKGIKPTRLWHLSGRKHIRDWINDRFTAIKGYAHEQRDAYEGLKLNAIVCGLCFALAYSFGMFSPEKYSPYITRTPPPKDCLKKCNEVPPSHPCGIEKKK